MIETYVPYEKARRGSSFERICPRPPPPVAALGCNHKISWAYRHLQEQMFGGPGNSQWCAVWAACGRRGWEQNLPKLVFWHVFFAAEGQASEYSGRLPSDCAADMRLPQVASWHRAWLTPLASASIKQLKIRIPERFLHRGGPREMRGKEPRCRRSLAAEMASGVRVGGWKGAKPSKTRVLARFCNGVFI